MGDAAVTERDLVRAGHPPEWASAWGQPARHGVYADLVVREITLRFRWIPPGEFVQGSLDGEAGRESHEGP